MIAYTKVDEGSVVDEHVTVRLYAGDHGRILGRVTTIGTGQGGDEAVSTEDDDPPIEFALRIARELAAAKGEAHIDILDPNRLWQDIWGKLETG